MTDREDLRRLAVRVAEASGAILRTHAERLDELDVVHKTSATDPVSEADRASERAIVEALLDARPDDGIMGEEDAGNRTGTTGLRWVIDPLDGTVNFLYGIPQWCVSVAVEDADGPVAGAVHDPSRGETFSAQRGGGAWCLDEPSSGERSLAVTAVDDLTHTLVATGFAYDPDVRRDQGALARALLGRVRDLRRGGAAALDLAWVAAGRLDAYVEHALAPWDWAAGRLLVTEAGGRVTPVQALLGGAPRDGVVASGPGVHDPLVAWVREQTGG